MRQQFDDSVLRHIETAYPAEFARWGTRGTRDFIARNVDRAISKGMNTTGAVITFLELLILFGEQFEESPVGENAVEILESTEFPGQLKIELLTECLTAPIGGRHIAAAT